MSYAPPLAVQTLQYPPRQQPASPTFHVVRSGVRIPTPDAAKPGPPTSPSSWFATPLAVFIVTGAVLLAMLCVVPVWNAAALIQDPNYTFWHGTWVPTWMIVQSVALIVLYLLTAFLFFKFARLQAQTEQSIMTMATIFITFFGLLLMIVALPLQAQANETFSSLLPSCRLHTTESRRLWEYYEVLQNMRTTPACMSKYSVEDCHGYETAAPYTGMLQFMETNYHCSGFCHHLVLPAAATPTSNGTVVHSKAEAVAAKESVAENATKAAASTEAKDEAAEEEVASAPAAEEPAAVPPAALVHSRSRVQPKRRFHHHVRAALGLLTEPVADEPDEKVSRYPPTLFSDANYKVSCEGMAARDLRNFAGDVATQTFYEGIYLLVIAIVAGFLKLFSVCAVGDIPLDKDTNEK